MNEQTKEITNKYPRTRFMGSKQKLLGFIYENVKDLDAANVLDAFSGSGCVAYLFKAMGKQVHTNDILKSCYMTSKASIENSQEILNQSDIDFVINKRTKHGAFISRTFKGLYFTDEDNNFLDQAYANIQLFKGIHKKAIALSALARACLKKRPRGIFTYTGMRYDDGRKDLKLSLVEHFVQSTKILNNCVFDNGKKNKSYNRDIFSFKNNDYDLVYIDPPYYSRYSDNDYSRRYHFIEGLMTNWSHVKVNEKTKTKKFNKIYTPFNSIGTTYNAFDKLFDNFKNSIIVVSYSSNSLPKLDEMVQIMKKYKKKVEVAELDHKYSSGTQNGRVLHNKVKEYLFIGKG